MLRLVLLVLGLIAITFASSHGEAPGTVAIPQADGTDLYVFRSYETGRSNFVTILANFLPLQSPFAGPNYFSLSDQHVYQIIIDYTGDAVQDITYQFVYGTRFGGSVANTSFVVEGTCDQQPTIITGDYNTGIALDIAGHTVPIALKYAGPISAGNTANLNWFEFYSINYITGSGSSSKTQPITQYESTNTVFTKPMDNVGIKTFPNYTAYANQYIYNISIPGCSTAGRVFVGQRKEPFQVNLGPIFDLVNFIPIPGFPGFVGESNRNNALGNRNVATFALEIPTACLTGTGNGVIGVWQTTRQLLHTTGSSHVVGKQVSRLGNPLLNEVMIGLPDKGNYNRGVPSGDAQLVLPYVQYPTFPQILSNLFLAAVNAHYGVALSTLAPNNYPRNDLVSVFLTGFAGVNQLQNVTVSDMIRLNTGIPITPAAQQNPLGVIGGDDGGYPNGRRPVDDTVDISLRALMGVLCTLGLGCNPSNAPIGGVPLTDGAPRL